MAMSFHHQHNFINVTDYELVTLKISGSCVYLYHLFVLYFDSIARLLRVVSTSHQGSCYIFTNLSDVSFLRYMMNVI